MVDEAQRSAHVAEKDHKPIWDNDERPSCSCGFNGTPDECAASRRQAEKGLKPRVYIAGPMTGLPEFNFPAFNAAEEQLRALGFETRNPARHGAGKPGQEWADYMRRDIPDLLECDAVALLPGWRNSRGARLEVQIAQALDMPLHDLAGLTKEADRG